MILEKRIYKKIESYLYSHFEKTEQLELEKDDILFGCKANHLGEETGGSIGTSNESKVENAAIKLIELKEDKNYKWWSVIQETIDEFNGTEYEKLIELTYDKQYQMPKILRLMNVERTGYYDRKNDVIMQVALKASSKGLIDNKVKKL